MTRLAELLEALQDLDDADRVAAAVEALNNEATEEWLPALRELLITGQDSIIREAAAWPVSRLEGLRSLRLLLAAKRRGATEGDDNDSLTTLIIDVVEAESAEAVPALLGLAVSQLDADREDAAWLLGFVYELLPSDSLTGLARDSVPGVRIAAFGSLASYIGDEATFNTLLTGVSDPVDEVAVSAATALGCIGDRRACEAIATLRKRVSAHQRPLLDSALEQLTWDSQ